YVVFIVLVTLSLIIGSNARAVNQPPLNIFDANHAVDAHNFNRANVIPRASNMLKMSWNSSLGKLAQNYANNCVYKHSKNRTNIGSFWYVGENMYLQSYFDTRSKALDNAIGSWQSESDNYNYQINRCSSGELCGHYTQMVWADSHALGCGVANCRNTAQLVICNYGPGGNVNRARPYQSGSSCSNCPYGTVTCSNRLC
uniref:SCP domain-containing protein n=1 Tax=Ciona intestinalis TaxID=7719 RepID=F7A2L3_CIOIN